MRTLLVIDAFTDVAFRGNPAAVVLLAADDTPTEEWMQQVAAEMKHSETAFVRPLGGDEFSLRWFTPTVEIDLCGHATLASAHALWETKAIVPDAVPQFHTRSGVLLATNTGAHIELDFPIAPATDAPAPAGLFDALGITDAPTAVAPATVLVELLDARAVRDLRPDFRALAQVDVSITIVTAVADDPDHDIVSRVFGPAIGIDEDPVTGAAHCTLAPYWSERLDRNPLRAFQASARGGEMLVEIRGDRVALAGTAVTVVRGELLPT